MTLSNVPRYDEDQVSRIGDRAVVLGAGIAGLLAARVLADAFSEVILIERDTLPETPEKRPGVPQATQPHQMHEAGRATLEDLFPGFGEEFLSTGGLMIDMASDMDFYRGEDPLADGPKRLPSYCGSRPLFEQIIRGRVTDFEEVTVMSGCRFVDYLTDERATAVEGVVVDDRDAGRSELAADLVVDAMGRTSRTPKWLENQGYEPPPVEEIRIDVTYSTIFVDRPPSARRLLVIPPDPPRTRGGGALPIEDGRWLVTLQDMYSDDMPEDRDEFLSFAGELPVPDLKRLLETRSWISDDIDRYRFPSNVRRRYEKLDRFPDGLLVTGDAIVSTNPVYGQGMSVAALEALQLHHTLASPGDDLTFRFFDRVEDIVDITWMIAVGADLQYPQAEGSRSSIARLFDWYTSRLLNRARSDGTLTDAYIRVMRMEEPPTSLFRPGLVWRVLFSQ